MVIKIYHKGRNVSLNKFKKIQIISTTFSYHNNMKLKAIYNKKTGKLIANHISDKGIISKRTHKTQQEKKISFKNGQKALAE